MYDENRAVMRKLRTIEMDRLTVSEFKDAEKMPLVVVLDDVRSMYNVGSVFRTGDAFRIEAVCNGVITVRRQRPSAICALRATRCMPSSRWSAARSCTTSRPRRAAAMPLCLAMR